MLPGVRRLAGRRRIEKSRHRSCRALDQHREGRITPGAHAPLRTAKDPESALDAVGPPKPCREPLRLPTLRLAWTEVEVWPARLHSGGDRQENHGDETLQECRLLKRHRWLHGRAGAAPIMTPRPSFRAPK